MTNVAPRIVGIAYVLGAIAVTMVLADTKTDADTVASTGIAYDTVLTAAGRPIRRRDPVTFAPISKPA